MYLQLIYHFWSLINLFVYFLAEFSVVGLRRKQNEKGK
jgi:hypothetical protein